MSLPTLFSEVSSFLELKTCPSQYLFLKFPRFGSLIHVPLKKTGSSEKNKTAGAAGADWKMPVAIGTKHNQKSLLKPKNNNGVYFRRFWGVKEPPSFRNHFRLKTVYLDNLYRSMRRCTTVGGSSREELFCASPSPSPASPPPQKRNLKKKQIETR